MSFGLSSLTNERNIMMGRWGLAIKLLSLNFRDELDWKFSSVPKCADFYIDLTSVQQAPYLSLGLTGAQTCAAESLQFFNLMLAFAVGTALSPVNLMQAAVSTFLSKGEMCLQPPFRGFYLLIYIYLFICFLCQKSHAKQMNNHNRVYKMCIKWKFKTFLLLVSEFLCIICNYSPQSKHIQYCMFLYAE